MRKLLLILILAATSSFHTPDEGIQEYDVLIGYNDDFYYSIKTIHYLAENRFQRIDSSFLLQRSLKTSLEVNRTLLRAAKHTDKSTEEDWETNEFINPDFKLEQFIIENKIKYLFPEIYENSNYRPYWFELDSEGLKISYRGETTVVQDMESIEKAASWMSESLKEQNEDSKAYPDERHNYVNTQSFVGDDKYLFVRVSSEIIPNRLESILVIEMDDFLKKKTELEARNR